MTRGGLWLATALLVFASPDALADEAGAETIVIQDASGRIVVVPAKPPAPAPKPAASAPKPAAPAIRPAAAARALEDVDPCAANRDLVESWRAARQRVTEAQEALEAAESIPLSGMGHYRDARIAAAERRLEKAETREQEIDARAADLRVPQNCFEEF